MKIKALKSFEYGDEVQTTFGPGIFQEYSNNGQSYRILFTDGDMKGQQLSLGERGISTPGRSTKSARVIDSKYAPYEGNEKIFNAPIGFDKPEMDVFLKQAHKWVLKVSACPHSLESVVKALTDAGLENASDYVHVRESAVEGREVGIGGPKYDLMIPDPDLPGIDLTLSLYFNAHRLASTGYYQIGRTEFALAVLPKVRVLEVGEKL